MRKYDILCYGLVACLLFVLLGCITPADSPTSRFYRLQAIDKIQLGEEINVPSGLIIGIGPVEIPEYQNRPQIVTQNENKMLMIAQFDRWGEPLDLGLARLISDDLTALLKDANVQVYPWNLAIPVKYQVIMDVIKLESQLDKDLFLVVQWSVLNAQTNKAMLMKRSEFRQPIEPHNYAGLTKTLSAECVELSREIAKALASLGTGTATKEIGG